MMIELEYDFIYTKYWLEDPAWSTLDLAKHYNCYVHTIIDFMKKYDINRRNFREAAINAYKCPSKVENLKKGMADSPIFNKTNNFGDKGGRTYKGGSRAAAKRYYEKNKEQIKLKKRHRYHNI